VSSRPVSDTEVPDTFSPWSRVAAMDRKLVVFVPSDALERVREALFAAGAGRIGDYELVS
jgi:hypothetical protein